MKILIIAQNSCPKQSPRAFRTAELSEELVRQGHEVVVYSVHGKYDYAEYERQTGVIMRDIKPKFATSGNDGYHRYNIFDQFMYHYFQRLLFWPECEFHFCVEHIIKKNPNMDLLITIASPHSIHSGAARAKRRNPEIFPKKWVADCGDPFMLDPYSKHPKYMSYFEKLWCQSSDYISVPTVESYKGYYPQFKSKIKVIPQGFDFSKTPIAQYRINDVPTFIFAGYIYKGKRDPSSFMDYLLKYKGPYKFKIFTFSALESKYIEESNGQIEFLIGYSRKQIIYECSKADFLINIPNASTVQSPSKLIDYGIASRPILDIDNTFSDDTIFQEFIRRDYSSKHVIDDLDCFRIENVSRQFLELV